MKFIDEDTKKSVLMTNQMDDRLTLMTVLVDGESVKDSDGKEYRMGRKPTELIDSRMASEVVFYVKSV